MFIIQSAPQLANCLMTTKYTYEKNTLSIIEYLNVSKKRLSSIQ